MPATQSMPGSSHMNLSPPLTSLILRVRLWVRDRVLKPHSERRPLSTLFGPDRLPAYLYGLERDPPPALVRLLFQARHDSRLGLLPQTRDRHERVRADLREELEHFSDLGAEVDPRRLPQAHPLSCEPLQAVGQREVGDVLETLGPMPPCLHRGGGVVL